MPIVKTEKYFQKVSFVLLLLATLKYPLCAYMFVGDYQYLDFLSLMKSGSGCKHPTSKDRCLIFMKEMVNSSAKSKLTKAQVKYTAFGRTYTFDLKHPPCKSAINSQNVEMMLICEGQTVGNGITCKSSADCDIKMEVCSRYQAIDQQICIPKRHINESCDVHSTCYDNNSECKYYGHSGTCQCLHDHKEIDGQCVKIGLALGENCLKEDQCSGTKYASRCLRNQTTETKVCSCMKGYIVSGSNCIKGGLSLNETCEIHQQCSSTEKANTCSSYGISQPTCRCNYGYIEKQSRCYRKNLHLFESCDWSEQCTGSHGANECKFVEGQRICYCPDGKGILKGSCFKVGLTLDEPCYVDGQCTGTPISGVCMANINTERVCHCNQEYIRYNESCLQANKSMYEDCDIDIQCNGTHEGGVCKELGHRKLCVCANGYTEDNSKFTCHKAKATTSWIDALKVRIQNRRRFKKDRSTCIPTESIHYSIAENSNIRFIEKAQSENNHGNHQNENNYDKANSIQERETEPLYNFSEPEPYGEENHYDGTYCHLYKKSLMMSADLYGIQNSMSVSSPSTMEAESS
uniref:Uncharacterized protein n=1 Tax=Magallana gigas TaxID=29159 RepID=A0A8W8LWR5_MAGGI